MWKSKESTSHGGLTIGNTEKILKCFNYTVWKKNEKIIKFYRKPPSYAFV